MHAQQSPEERVAEIQAALRDARLDGWLFYDLRHSDPLAYRILKLDQTRLASRQETCLSRLAGIARAAARSA